VGGPLTDKVVIITGGSRGIGRATAIAAASRGYRVCIGYASNEAAAQSVVSAIEAKNGKAIAVKCDVGFELGTPEQKIFKDWLTNRYHAPSDDVNQPVDLSAAALYEDIVRRLLIETANTPAPPQWKQDSFFRRYATAAGD